MLGVKSTSIVIRGFDGAGSFYGSQTLIQLFEYFRTTAVSPLFVYDYPELPVRGVYMRVKWEHDWPFTKELLSEMITRYKCNYFSPEIHMSSISHPEIPPPNETPVTLPSAQDMLNFTATHYMNNIVTWYPGPPQGTPVPEECVFDSARLARLNDLANDVKVYLNPPYVHCHESELSVLGCALRDRSTATRICSTPCCGRIGTGTIRRVPCGRLCGGICSGRTWVEARWARQTWSPPCRI